MVQQLAVTTLLWTVCVVITTDARRRHLNNYLFTGGIDRSSSPAPIHQYWLYQGDIKLAEYQNDMVDNPHKKIDITKAFSQGVEEKRIWFRGIIPYVIDCSLKNMPGLVAQIKRAMKEWESKTCVTFVERKDEEDYVTIMRGTHCYSTVGRVEGEKVLSIGHGCEHHNVMLHEIGHTIGFWHEQSRPDRDENVRVLWRNIRQGWESAFVKLSYKVRSSMLLPYDYSSIMHYPFNAFSKSSRKRTIIALKPVIARPYKKLSKFDILRVNMLYDCKGAHANDVESTSDPSFIHAYRRMKRGVEDVEDVDLYKTQRKQRSLGCKNNDGDEACQYWAEKGFCITRKDFMLTDCAKSCNTCSTDEHYRPSLKPHVTAVSYATSVRLGVVERERRTRRRDGKRKARKEVREVYRKRLRLCVDKKTECVYWASRGFCQARPDLMQKQCRKSCDKCYPDPSHCVDRDSRCKYWATHHYCRKKDYKTVLKTFCQKSCGNCIPDKKACRDKEYDKCSQWRKHGLCYSRDKEVSEAMKIMCERSCGVCGEQKQHEEAIKSLCKDKFKTCKQWKKQGHCKAKKDFMNKFCKESCNTCFTSDNHIEDCLDNSVACDAFKARGKCETNSQAMFRLCRKTCGFCFKQNQNDVHKLQQGVPCSDKSKLCSQFLAWGYCDKKYVLYMMKNCQKSCGLCHDGNSYADVDVRPSTRQVIKTKPCTNTLKGCSYWARIGYCNLRPDLMLKKCKLACRACHPEKKCENIEDDHNCKHWAKLGKCSTRMDFMIEKCPKSCNACPSRRVKTKPEKPVGILCPTACKNWLERGYCFKLKRRCRRTCLARGCDTAPLRLDGFCGNPMGAGWDFKLPDTAFNASSTLKNGNWDFGARNARLYKEDDPVYRRVGAWCAKKQHDQWLQVDLGSVKIITAVATQGRDQYFEHVKSYELGFSNDGKTFYKYKEKGVDKILRGNCDHFTPAINPLHRPYAARFIRFYPKTHNNICMRVEIYGCNHLEGKAQRKYGKVIYPERRKHL